MEQLTLTHPFRERHCTKLHGQTGALISFHEPPDNTPLLYACAPLRSAHLELQNNHIRSFLFPSALEPEPRNAVSTFLLNIFFVVTFLRSAHSQLAGIYCSLHNQLPCDTYLCCKRRFSVCSPPYLPLAAMCISCNYNSD